jgi:DNA-binding LacI/PurR family transcriptional regulator
MKKKAAGAAAQKPANGAKTRGRGARKLQMEDIAQMAGVSISTVSRALKQSSLVNPETRDRIVKLARSLQYSVNVGASNLRMQRNRTVAVVLPFDSVTRQSVSDPFFVILMGSLADALTARGYDMLVSRVDAERLTLAEDIAASGRAVGVIMIGQWHHHDQINEMAARHAPVVVWGAQLRQQLYCTIGGDNIAGGMLATEHLLAQGRRRIAFFGDVELPEIGQRYEGYGRLLAQHRIGTRRAHAIHRGRRQGGRGQAGATEDLVRCHFRGQRPAGDGNHRSPARAWAQGSRRHRCGGI